MKKQQLGQYFTKKGSWLKPQIRDFIIESKCKTAYDPFAGEGHLLKISKEYGIKQTIGLDIDNDLNWINNDSLKNIPQKKDAIIITNPPYLTIYSAKRKKIYKGLEIYFQKHTDLYQLAIDKMLEAQDYIVTIIPETYINSTSIKKHIKRINNITILNENPFEDTENPVCVVCFDNIAKMKKDIKIYIDENYIDNFENIELKKLKPKKNVKIDFNNPNGSLAIRAVDMPNPQKTIEFMNIKKLNYNLANIKNSSRLITVVDIDLEESKVDILAKKCNEKLYNYRKETMDVTLSPFKGNVKNGKRRRRLDYKTARAIIEMSMLELELI